MRINRVPSLDQPPSAAAATSRNFAFPCTCVWKPIDCARQNKRAGRWFPISAAADVKSTSVPVPVRVTVHLCALHPRYRRLRFLWSPTELPTKRPYTQDRSDPKPLIRRVFSLRIYRRNIIPAASQQSLDLPPLAGTSLIIGWSTDFCPCDPANLVQEIRSISAVRCVLSYKKSILQKEDVLFNYSYLVSILTKGVLTLEM